MSGERPWQDGELLRELYRDGYRTGGLAEHFDCHRDTIIKWLKRAIEGTELGHTCPTCDKQLPTKKGRDIHHSKTHGEDIGRTELTCAECGGVFEVPDAKANQKLCSTECRTEHARGEVVERTCEHCDGTFGIEKYRLKSEPGRFCSRECKDDWQSEHIRGEAHPRWAGTQPTADCGICGDEFAATPGNPNRFCSRGCRDEWQSGAVEGEAHPMWNGGKTVHNVCGECGVEFYTHPGSSNPDDYCSRECFWDAHRGEDHWAWDGGPFPYGPKWNDAKKEIVRERDGRECRICGKSEAKHLDEYEERLTVHHIVRARRLQDAPAELRNGPFNLVAICCTHNNRTLEAIPPWVQFMAFLPHPPLPAQQMALGEIAADG